MPFMTSSWREGPRRNRKLLNQRCLSTERTNNFLHIADLGDFQSKIFTDFHCIAHSDRFVVDQQLQRLVAAFGEFDDRAGAQAHHFAEGELRSASLTMTGTSSWRMRRRSGCAAALGGLAAGGG